jgi:hypothetical protein
VSQYYFLVASLPLLSYEDRDAAEPSEFLTMLGDHLTDTDLDIVARATIEAPREQDTTGNETVRAWVEFERGLRNALARLRAGRRLVDPAQFVRNDQSGNEGSDSFEMREAVRDAWNQDSPLSSEDSLDRARWNYLDDLEVGHFFDLDIIIVYYLKLQILARRRLFDRKEGEAQFVKITRRIMNDYYQEQSE